MADRKQSPRECVYNEEHLQLLTYYGLEARTIHLPSPNENAAVESSNGGLKWVVRQYLLLRSSDVVIDVLGQKFKGILASDCFLAYDEKRLSTWLKQKCVSHLLTDLKEMKESKSGRALQFARQMTIVLQEALALKRQKSSLDPFTFFQRARDLETRLDA